MKQQLPKWRTDNIYALIGCAVMLITALGGVFYRQGMTDDKLDNLIALVQEIKDTQQINQQAMNRLESHVCTLDTRSNLTCIANQ